MAGLITILGGKKRKKTKAELWEEMSSSSDSSKLSVTRIQNIIERLMCSQIRASTTKTYLNVWHQFNDFLIKLDRIPKKWEDRATLYIGFMIEKGCQSSTVKSYVSAIKKLLVLDGYKWKDQEIMLSCLTKACKIKNDRVRTRLPIHCGLLEMILFEVQRYFRKKNQRYLEILYKALFSLGYYGLMRVGELTFSPHVLKAKDIHLGSNKDKIMVVLYSSKTHDESNRPQKIKITAHGQHEFKKKRSFCPFKLLGDYIKIRGGYAHEQEQFFVFRDKSKVTPDQARSTLRDMIELIGLDQSVYDMHSLRIGRASDLVKWNYPVEVVKRMGRWRSNTVYKYIRQ